MFVSEKNAYMYNALRILMNFLCTYLGEKGRGALMHVHVYVWEHIVSLYYRTA